MDQLDKLDIFLHAKLSHFGWTAEAIVDENSDARIKGLRVSLSVLGLIALVGLFTTGKIPTKPPGGVSTPAAV